MVVVVGGVGDCGGCFGCWWWFQFVGMDLAVVNVDGGSGGGSGGGCFGFWIWNLDSIWVF